MRKLANVLWHVPFLGFINAFVTFLIGVLFVITVIGAPIGLGLIQLSKYLLTPFSSVMINRSDIKTSQNKARKAFGIIARILYFPFGLALSVLTVIQIASLFFILLNVPVALVKNKSVFRQPGFNLILTQALGAFFSPVDKIRVDKPVDDEMSWGKLKAKAD